MAAAIEISDWSLRDVFDRAWSLYKEIESFHGNSSDEAHQSRIGEAIKQFEQATVLVNDLALFSDNEDIIEVTTPSVRYLLLPSLLGQLQTKLIDRKRRERLETGRVYFLDFLQRCDQYGLEIRDRSVLTDASEEGEHRLDMRSDMGSMAAQRQAKIEEYRRMKANEERLVQLEEAMKRQPDDEENERKYFILQLNACIQKAVDELKSITQEIEILEHMEKAKPEDRRQQTSQSGGSDAFGRQPKGPFLLLTRNKAQKEVFGAGYPSLPKMTVEEFYEQRYREQMAAAAKEAPQVAEASEDRKSEEEDEEEEEKLKRIREWDDFKDTNRRGWGNRQNMG